MRTSKYTDLPDSLSPDETRKLFWELLGMGRPKDREEALEIAEAMEEVADRHWHTYTLLDDQTRQAVDGWVIANWDRNSQAMARRLISIVARIGLVRSFEMLRRELDSDLLPEVRDEISGALRELEETVNDPYSGMKKGGGTGEGDVVKSLERPNGTYFKD